MTQGDAVATPRPEWSRVERLLMAAVAGCVLLAGALLAVSLAEIRELELELRRAEDTSEQFVAVMREASRVEVELVRGGEPGDPAVDDRLALLSRHVDVLLRRQSTLPLTDQQATRVATIDTTTTALRAALEPSSFDADAAIASATLLERTAKASADHADTTRRAETLAQVATTRTASGILLGAVVLLVVGTAVLLRSVRRRELQGYAAAVDEATDRALDLEDRNAALRAANDTKERFLSMVSHELRTPLTLVRGFAETLQEHGAALGPDEQAHLVAAIVRHAKRQQRIVDDLLTLAKHTDHAPLPSPTVLDAADAIPAAVADLGEVGARTTVLPGPRCMLWVDPGHLEQVLENLLTNAHKYGGPTVEVSWAAGTDSIALVVEDDGPGVPDEFVPALFTPFAQADDGDTRVSKGVGLGLTVTHLLVEANDGRIRHRHRDGGGARFEVHLPRASAQQVGADVTVDRRQVDRGPAWRRHTGAEVRRAADGAAPSAPVDQTGSAERPQAQSSA